MGISSPMHMDSRGDRMNSQMIKIAKNMLSMGIVKRDGENSWKVDDQIVLNHVDKGSSKLTCSCKNASIYMDCDCQHKIAVTLLESQGKFPEVAETLIKKYKGYKNINMVPTDPLDCFIEDIKLLRYVK